MLHRSALNRDVRVHGKPDDEWSISDVLGSSDEDAQKKDDTTSKQKGMTKKDEGTSSAKMAEKGSGKTNQAAAAKIIAKNDTATNVATKTVRTAAPASQAPAKTTSIAPLAKKSAQASTPVVEDTNTKQKTSPTVSATKGAQVGDNSTKRGVPLASNDVTSKSTTDLSGKDTAAPTKVPARMPSAKPSTTAVKGTATEVADSKFELPKNEFEETNNTASSLGPAMKVPRKQTTAKTGAAAIAPTSKTVSIDDEMDAARTQSDLSTNAKSNKSSAPAAAARTQNDVSTNAKANKTSAPSAQGVAPAATAAGAATAAKARSASPLARNTAPEVESRLGSSPATKANVTHKANNSGASAQKAATPANKTSNQPSTMSSKTLSNRTLTEAAPRKNDTVTTSTKGGVNLKTNTLPNEAGVPVQRVVSVAPAPTNKGSVAPAATGTKPVTTAVPRQNSFSPAGTKTPMVPVAASAPAKVKVTVANQPNPSPQVASKSNGIVAPPLKSNATVIRQSNATAPVAGKSNGIVAPRQQTTATTVAAKSTGTTAPALKPNVTVARGQTTATTMRVKANGTIATKPQATVVSQPTTATPVRTTSNGVGGPALKHNVKVVHQPNTSTSVGTKENAKATTATAPKATVVTAKSSTNVTVATAATPKSTAVAPRSNTKMAPSTSGNSTLAPRGNATAKVVKGSKTTTGAIVNTTARKQNTTRAVTVQDAPRKTITESYSAASPKNTTASKAKGKGATASNSTGTTSRGKHTVPNKLAGVSEEGGKKNNAGKNKDEDSEEEDLDVEEKAEADENEKDETGEAEVVEFQSKLSEAEAPLNVVGFEKVKALDDEAEMKHFASRLMDGMGFKETPKGTFFSELGSVDSFEEVVAAIKNADKKTLRSTCIPKSGAVAPMSENGYRCVAQMVNNTEMEKYMQRVTEDMELVIKDGTPMKEAVPLYSGEQGIQSLAKLQEELLTAVSQPNSWITTKAADASSAAAGSQASASAGSASAVAAGSAGAANATPQPTAQYATVAAQSAGSANATAQVSASGEIHEVPDPMAVSTPTGPPTSPSMPAAASSPVPAAPQTATGLLQDRGKVSLEDLSDVLKSLKEQLAEEKSVTKELQRDLIELEKRDELDRSMSLKEPAVARPAFAQADSEPLGQQAKLDTEGYEKIVSLRDDAQLSVFFSRIADAIGLFVEDGEGISKLSAFQDVKREKPRSFPEVLAELVEASKAKTWIRPRLQKMGGDRAMLNETGYTSVLQMCNDAEMSTFIDRVIKEKGMKITDLAKAKKAINEMAPYYSGNKAIQSYGQLCTELEENTKHGGWLAL